MPDPPRLLQIDAVPPGEAPEWVRQKWAGLRLPIAGRGRAARPLRTGGVLTGPKDFFAQLAALFSGKYERRSGYAVEVLAAVDVLARHSPEAAAWWRENAPHMMVRGRFFVFPEEVGHVVEPHEG